MKSWLMALLMMSGYLSGIGLLVFGGVTGSNWASNIGLPLVLIVSIPIAYQLAKEDLE